MFALHCTLCIVLRMTNVPDFIIEAGWRYQSGAQLWQNWRPCRVHLVVRDRTKTFGSATGGPASRSGTPGWVVTKYKGSTTKDVAPWRYCYFTPSTSKIPKSRWGNGTTTAPMPKVNPSQQIIRVWPCNIHPGAATTQVYWRSECSTTDGQCKSEHSERLKGYFWGSKRVHGGNCVHEHSLANIIWWKVLDGWRSLETRHWSSGSLAAISRCCCRYAIFVSIARRSISQNWSTNTGSCKSWILFNAPLSHFGYCLRLKIDIVKTENKYNSRMVDRWGTSNCCP